ncbi:MAG TPA: FtsH protease activity modulator HflK, partial [Symbiobacteriaceae bacterium]|nr:FtsH protease activity modulator HflK [Symbiobacteriaceae bacterium]
MRPIWKAVITVAAVAIAADLAMTSWFRVAEHEEALVMTFGRPSTQVQKGVHTKLPWPIQTVATLPVRITQQMTFGYREKDGKMTEVPEEAMMITGDEGIIWADLLVEWRVSDISKYLFATEQPEEMLRNATSAALRSVIGSTQLDKALTVGKIEIQAAVQQRLVDLVQSYDVGIRIESVKLQDVEPPADVADAFKDVNNARETMVTKQNEAEKYRNEQVPTARGKAQGLIEQATGNKLKRVNAAKGDVAKYQALYDAYKANPAVTRDRLVLETLDAILPGAQIYVMDSSEGTVKYLPLER